MEQRTAEQYYLFRLFIQLEQMYILTFLYYPNTLKTRVYLNNFVENKIIIPILCTKTRGTEELEAPV